MTPVIETAGDLYREMKVRGLHLRHGIGRDDALIKELANKLGFPDTELQKHLDTSALPAEEFLKFFLQAAAPFASMYQEIWDYLGSQHSPNATEMISVRFGFEGTNDSCSVNLEQFRRYAETTKLVFRLFTVQVWNRQALDLLFEIRRKLISYEFIRHSGITYERYVPGKPYQLPVVSVSEHPFDLVVKSICEMFQQVINERVTEMDQEKISKYIPEIKEEQATLNDANSLERIANLLTDLLPTWFYIFEKCGDIPQTSKDDAFDEYERLIKPLLILDRSIKEAKISEALDILDLPFWKHRWHTYEIWATILTIKSLDEYKPSLQVKEGITPIDGYSSAIIAKLKTLDECDASIAIQVETPFESEKRKAIKPDLRVCDGDPHSADNTIAVVEFKQRLKMDSSHLSEMAQSYSLGCPKSGGLLILNYDQTGASVKLPPSTYFIEGVHPLNPTAIDFFKERLTLVMDKAGLKPVNESVIVLLDVSSSMEQAYESSKAQSALLSIIKLPGVKVLRFNNGLVEGGDLNSETAKSLSITGGTELGRALSDLKALYGYLPSKLLIVTDGEHDSPDILSQIPDVKECMPNKIEDHIVWLRD